MSDFRVGVSGWTYSGWRKVFYPDDLPQRCELEYASRAFRAIEINGTHYSLQRPETFAEWHARTPDDFVFTVKAGRYITHMRKLVNVEAPVANFFASGLLALREKLGSILWQFPPRFRYDSAKMEAFFGLLPFDTHEAVQVARGHSEWMNDRVFLETDARRPIRHAIEVRHDSFLVPEFFESLRRRGIAWVITDTGGRWPYAEDRTADFAYLRLHGPEELYASGYPAPALDWWANRLQKWASGRNPDDPRHILADIKTRSLRQAFVFFDNDAKVDAPRDAASLASRLGHGDQH
ncbi:MAG: DUF72 domain-containing protein [Terrimicrobiaceae bacterium]|nr:DUF72 domain-containing protein [Terrimicrobiaceae bacterium]